MSERAQYSQEQIDITIEFWMRVFEIEDEDTRAKFREALERTVTPTGPMWMQVDYDPFDDLLACVLEAGVECRGSFFSAQGILPEKTETRMRHDGVVIKLGYGNWLGIAHEVEDLDVLLDGYQVGPEKHRGG
jgi:hypothetical protein